MLTKHRHHAIAAALRYWLTNLVRSWKHLFYTDMNKTIILDLTYISKLLIQGHVFKEIRYFHSAHTASFRSVIL